MCVGAPNASFFTAHDTSNILYIVLIYLSAFSTGRHQCRSILSTCEVKKQSDLKGSDVFVQGKTDDLKTETCSHHWLKLSQKPSFLPLGFETSRFCGYRTSAGAYGLT